MYFATVVMNGQLQLHKPIVGIKAIVKSFVRRHLFLVSGQK